MIGRAYAYVICMYACVLLLGCMFAILVSCMQKLFQVSLWIMLINSTRGCWLHQFRGRLLAQVSLKQRIDKAMCFKIIGVWWKLMKIHLKI